VISITHSLHRKGNIDDLKQDYVILAMLSRNINDKYPDSRERLIKVGNILKEHSPVNMMSENLWTISPVITAVYDNIHSIKKILKKLKEEDLGISIVVSGLISEIQSVAKEVGLKLHTAHLSLGIFGNKENLPDDKILSITTMCGHHCISPKSIADYVQKIKEKKITIDKAAEKLAKPCVCGIFNINRAKNLLKSLI